VVTVLTIGRHTPPSGATVVGDCTRELSVDRHGHVELEVASFRGDLNRGERNRGSTSPRPWSSPRKHLIQ
jgi:hypothetical protein